MYTATGTSARRLVMKAVAIAAISAGAATSAFAYERPVSAAKIFCTPSIDERRRLVETVYGVIDGGSRSYLIKIDEKVIKYPAGPEDLKWHRTGCLPRNPGAEATADILRK